MANPAPHAKKTRAPSQARSRDTERRLLTAATAIIEREGVAALSVAKVVRLAKSSVGSFYARFEDKDDLLRAVHRTRMHTLLERLDELADGEACVGIDGQALLTMCIREMVNHYERHPRLMAAFHARSAADPASWSEAVSDHLRLADTIVALLCQGQWPAARDDLRRALTLAIHMVLSFLGDLSLHAERVPDLLPFDTAALVPELTRMVRGYVTSAAAANGAPERRDDAHQKQRRDKR